MKWELGENLCPRCGDTTEEMHDSDELMVGERCTRCRWEIDLSGNSPRRVRYRESAEEILERLVRDGKLKRAK